MENYLKKGLFSWPFSYDRIYEKVLWTYIYYLLLRWGCAAEFISIKIQKVQSKTLRADVISSFSALFSDIFVSLYFERSVCLQRTSSAVFPHISIQGKILDQTFWKTSYRFSLVEARIEGWILTLKLNKSSSTSDHAAEYYVLQSSLEI